MKTTEYRSYQCYECKRRCGVTGYNKPTDCETGKTPNYVELPGCFEELWPHCDKLSSILTKNSTGKSALNGDNNFFVSEREKSLNRSVMRITKTPMYEVLSKLVYDAKDDFEMAKSKPESESAFRKYIQMKRCRENWIRRTVLKLMITFHGWDDEPCDECGVEPEISKPEKKSKKSHFKSLSNNRLIWKKQ